MAYVTYDEYRQFGGTASNVAFPLLERKTCRMIDNWTQWRLVGATKIPSEVKEVMTEIINRLASSEQGGQKLSSFSNGKVSMKFDNARTEEQELYQIALDWLPVSLISGVVE